MACVFYVIACSIAAVNLVLPIHPNCGICTPPAPFELHPLTCVGQEMSFVLAVYALQGRGINNSGQAFMPERSCCIT